MLSLGNAVAPTSLGPERAEICAPRVIGPRSLLHAGRPRFSATDCSATLLLDHACDDEGARKSSASTSTISPLRVLELLSHASEPCEVAALRERCAGAFVTAAHAVQIVPVPCRSDKHACHVRCCV